MANLDAANNPPPVDYLTYPALSNNEIERQLAWSQDPQCRVEPVFPLRNPITLLSNRGAVTVLPSQLTESTSFVRQAANGKRGEKERCYPELEHAGNIRPLLADMARTGCYKDIHTSLLAIDGRARVCDTAHIDNVEDETHPHNCTLGEEQFSSVILDAFDNKRQYCALGIELDKPIASTPPFFKDLFVPSHPSDFTHHSLQPYNGSLCISGHGGGHGLMHQESAFSHIFQHLGGGPVYFYVVSDHDPTAAGLISISHRYQDAPKRLCESLAPAARSAFSLPVLDLGEKMRRFGQLCIVELNFGETLIIRPGAEFGMFSPSPYACLLQLARVFVHHLDDCIGQTGRLGPKPPTMSTMFGDRKEPIEPESSRIVQTRYRRWLKQMRALDNILDRAVGTLAAFAWSWTGGADLHLLPYYLQRGFTTALLMRGYDLDNKGCNENQHGEYCRLAFHTPLLVPNDAFDHHSHALRFPNRQALYILKSARLACRKTDSIEAQLRAAAGAIFATLRSSIAPESTTVDGSSLAVRTAAVLMAHAAVSRQEGTSQKWIASSDYVEELVEWLDCDEGRSFEPLQLVKSRFEILDEECNKWHESDRRDFGGHGTWAKGEYSVTGPTAFLTADYVRLAAYSQALQDELEQGRTLPRTRLPKPDRPKSKETRDRIASSPFYMWQNAAELLRGVNSNSFKAVENALEKASAISDPATMQRFIREQGIGKGTRRESAQRKRKVVES